jgi:hypothetical protein
MNATSRPLYPQGRGLVPIVQEAGWVPGPVWTHAEPPPLLETDPRTVQLLASRYTDCAIPTHFHLHLFFYKTDKDFVLLRKACKLSLPLPWRDIRGEELHLHSVLTSGLYGGEWSASRPGGFTPEKKPWHVLSRRWVGSREGLEVLEKRKSLLPLLISYPRTVQAVA